VKGEKNLRTCGLLEHNIDKQTQDIFLPNANRQVKIIYQSDAQEIDSKETTTIEPINNIRKRRHIKYTLHPKMKINKSIRIKQSKRIIYNYNKKMRLQKLEQTLHSYIINKRRKEEIKEKDEIAIKKFKRSRELVQPPSLLDQGIKHGGNADYTSESNGRSSVSSFENSLLNCYNGAILLAHEFQPSDQCTNISYLLNSKHIQANHHVEQDGYYYYIFYSDNDIVSNDIYAIFDIYKPTFQYENVTKACINQTECSFSISLLSADRVIVEIPTKDGIEHNEMDNVGTLISICQPRMGAYMIFPIATLLLILGCAFI